MIKCVMMESCRYLFGLFCLAAHLWAYYRLFGTAVTLVIAGVQLLAAAGIVCMRIRAPD